MREFPFQHPITILQVNEYSQSLKLHNLQGDLDLLWSYILSTKNTGDR